jgi:hypothetical protein
MKCPNCGTQSTGRFCSSCGASLRAADCSGCGTKLVPGARFCTQCGTPAADAPAARRLAGAGTGDAGSSNLPWYIAGAVLVVLIVILVLPMVRDDSGASVTRAPFTGSGAPGTPPPLTGTPREQADALFNRIMGAREAGDSAGAVFFTPMAIQAYAAAQPLDDDGLFHLAAVHNVAGDHASAIAVAEQILARNPNHLLALAAAGEASELAGDSAAARNYYSRFLAAYDTEFARGLPEYQDHARIFPEYQAAARRVTSR